MPILYHGCGIRKLHRSGGLLVGLPWTRILKILSYCNLYAQDITRLIKTQSCQDLCFRFAKSARTLWKKAGQEG